MSYNPAMSEIAEDGGLYTETIGGVDLSLRRHTPDRHVARSCLVNGEFDACLELLPELRHGLIIDAGGYIGTAAIVFARAYPDARVLSLEPSRENFALLQRNVRPFPNIVPINSAVVARSRTLQLKDRGTGAWGFSVVEAPRDNADAAPMHSVQGVTLDELIFDQGARGVDILKLDIEGGEKEVFDYAGYWSHHTTILVAELHNRIVAGCGESFRVACAHLRLVDRGRDKVVAVNDALLGSDGDDVVGDTPDPDRINHGGRNAPRRR